MGKDKNKDKEHQDGETAASSKTITSPPDANQFNRDLSWHWEARDAALAKTIAESHSYVIVEKDTGSHHSPNHTIKKKLRICLDRLCRTIHDCNRIRPAPHYQK